MSDFKPNTIIHLYTPKRMGTFSISVTYYHLCVTLSCDWSIFTGIHFFLKEIDHYFPLDKILGHSR
jgi:hypothetical protein